MGKFELYVDDNFHYGSEEGSGPEKSFDTYEEAEATAKKIIDGFLTGVDFKGMTAEELFTGWRHHGESPYIVSKDKEYVEEVKARGEAALAVIQKRMEMHGQHNIAEILKPMELPHPRHFSASDYARQRCSELCPGLEGDQQKEILP